MRVAALGGRGLLGTAVTPLLVARGHEVVIASRSAEGTGHAKVDLATGHGLAEAIEGCDVVLHLASDVRDQKGTDLKGTRRLLEVIDGQHLVYMSIVGVDKHPFGYYRTKHQVEQMIEASGVPHTIVRATQFHEFIAFVLGAMTKGPVALIPKKFVFQPIATSDVAEMVADVVDKTPSGLLPDIAGPEIHTAEYLARSFMEARGRERPILNMPLVGATATAFRSGVHTNPDRAIGRSSWEEWLAAQTWNN